MKRTLISALSLVPLVSLPLAIPAHASEEEAIRATVETAYVRGIHIERDPELIRGGFHEDFVMFVKTDEGIVQVTRDGWIARIEEAKKKDPGAPRPKIDHRFKLVDHTGDAAMVKIEIDRDGKHVFTDYMLLYKIGGDWKIIGKIFHSHS